MCILIERYLNDKENDALIIMKSDLEKLEDFITETTEATEKRFNKEEVEADVVLGTKYTRIAAGEDKECTKIHLSSLLLGMMKGLGHKKNLIMNEGEEIDEILSDVTNDFLNKFKLEKMSFIKISTSNNAPSTFAPKYLYAKIKFSSRYLDDPIIIPILFSLKVDFVVNVVNEDRREITIELENVIGGTNFESIETETNSEGNEVEKKINLDSLKIEIESADFIWQESLIDNIRIIGANKNEEIKEMLEEYLGENEIYDLESQSFSSDKINFDFFEFEEIVLHLQFKLELEEQTSYSEGELLYHTNKIDSTDVLEQFKGINIVGGFSGTKSLNGSLEFFGGCGSKNIDSLTSEWEGNGLRISKEEISISLEEVAGMAEYYFSKGESVIEGITRKTFDVGNEVTFEYEGITVSLERVVDNEDENLGTKITVFDPFFLFDKMNETALGSFSGGILDKVSTTEKTVNRSNLNTKCYLCNHKDADGLQDITNFKEFNYASEAVDYFGNVGSTRFLYQKTYYDFHFINELAYDLLGTVMEAGGFDAGDVATKINAHLEIENGTINNVLAKIDTYISTLNHFEKAIFNTDEIGGNNFYDNSSECPLNANMFEDAVTNLESKLSSSSFKAFASEEKKFEGKKLESNSNYVKNKMDSTLSYDSYKFIFLVSSMNNTGSGDLNTLFKVVNTLVGNENRKEYMGVLAIAFNVQTKQGPGKLINLLYEGNGGMDVNAISHYRNNDLFLNFHSQKKVIKISTIQKPLEIKLAGDPGVVKIPMYENDDGSLAEETISSENIHNIFKNLLKTWDRLKGVASSDVITDPSI